jgi:ABC-2 type transport system ATP-binding protein
MDRPAIETYELTKIYGNGVKALDKVSLKIEENSITSILGPNGAGKTTLLRILSTQLLPTSGRAYIYGYDVVKDASKIREFIAVVPQDGRPYLMVTPWDEIYFGARIRGFSRDEARKRTIEILKLLDLYEFRDTKIIKLSGGQRQKVLIGRTLVSDAAILFLDEPTIGLDPLSRRVIWKDIMKLKEEGKTIILTTHYMDEAEFLSDYVYIIHKGRILAEGSVDSLKASIKNDSLIYLESNGKSVSLPNRWEVRRIGNKYMVRSRNDEELIEIIQYAVKNKIKLYIKPTTLEDVFIDLVGEDYEKESG